MTSKMVKSAWASMGHFLHNLNFDVKKIIEKHEHLHLKILKRKYSEIFYRTCLNNDSLPKLVGRFLGFLWHINLCRLFNAKSIFMQIVLFQKIQFNISIQFNCATHFNFKLFSLFNLF